MKCHTRAWCPKFAPRFWALTWAEKYPRGSPACPLLTISRCPFRFDLHDPILPQRIAPIAAPLPLLRAANQTAFHRIPMQVAQLHRELAVISHVAVVVSLLPE